MSVRVDVREAGEAVVESIDVLIETSFAVIIYIDLTMLGKGSALSGKSNRSIRLKPWAVEGECEVEIFGLPFECNYLATEVNRYTVLVTALADKAYEKGRQAYIRAECADKQ